MNILYLSLNRVPGRGTHAVNIMNTCAAFARLPGLKVKLIIFRNRSFSPGGLADVWPFYRLAPNFEIEFIPALPGILGRISVLKKFFGLIQLALRLRREFCRRQDDFVIYSRHPKLAHLVRRLAARVKNPVYKGYFCELHHLFPGKVGPRLFQGIVAISGSLEEDLRRSDRAVSLPPVLVAHDGVNLEKYRADVDSQEARRRLGLPLDKTIIAYTGRLIRGKGVETLISAFAGLKNRDRLLLLLVGQVYSPIYAGSVAKLALENVRFTGFIPPGQVHEFQLCADILVLPSGQDLAYARYTSPIKLFEYMASGKPLVASALAGITEVIRDGENGLLFPPSDSGALAQAMQYLLDHPAKARQLADRARQDAALYTWGQRAVRIHRFIEQYSSSSPRPPSV